MGLLSPIYLVLYLLNLVYNIIKSSFETALLCVLGRIDPQVVEVDTVLKKNISHYVLANSITLTPGTLTVDIDHEKQKLYVAVLTPRDVKSIIPFEGYIRGVFE
ncbi:MAG: Na+/H+ antiporter subunit E [Candidatus Altiarchaeota archaeon]|nr:Na+/H+ antiporter subunit E [Candidatus Altiarchaeota archaeon]